MDAPVAFNVVDEPLHIVTLLPALTVGNAFTFTVTFAVFTQPLASVPVTVYVVAVVGVAIGFVHVLHDKLPVGV